ncbi:hypothetical protein [Nocardia tengchongensis]|uniref:hypothetical protein n=1 Tax=Nocardia tengchongensis TaxID=2055889 RepID=UPI0036488343
MSFAASILELSMTTPSAHHLAGSTLLAETTEVNTTGVKKWILDNAIPLLILVIGAAALLGALKGNFSTVISKVGLSFFGIVMVVLAGSMGAVTGVGSYLLSLIGINV